MATPLVSQYSQQDRPYEDRISHETSLLALIMAIFACTGGMLFGGLTALVTDGVLVWISLVVGMASGILTFALCRISGRCSRMEEQYRVSQTDPSDESAKPKESYA